jgi:cystathionine beta-lyase/cystathionine gamma-synthase
VHTPPLDLSSTYPLPDVERGGDSYEALATGGTPIPGGSHVYARLWNPTVSRFEEALATLEAAEASVAFASGMAALTAAILSHTVSIGRPHVVAVRPLYGGSDHLLASGLLGTQATFCGPDEVGASLRPETGLVIVETPANPTLELVDIAAVVAQANDVPVLVDNTFATPVLQQPLAHGATMSLHSATKYLGGHGDVVGGVIACGAESAAALRRVRAITGGILHPLGAYLLHRGLRPCPCGCARSRRRPRRSPGACSSTMRSRRCSTRACTAIRRGCSPVSSTAPARWCRPPARRLRCRGARRGIHAPVHPCRLAGRRR